LAYRPRSSDGVDSQAATEPPLPEDVGSLDELYLTGLHLAQYRHATRTPERYWREALRRDPADSRCNTAMGEWHLRRGELADAVRHLRQAIATLTKRNPNPRDGEPLYLLGVALRHLDEHDAAYDAFYKATWNAAWQSPAHFALAMHDCRRRQWAKALGHLDRALRVNADHLQARDLKAIVLRRLGRDAEATSLLEATVALNPTAYLARQLLGRSPTFDAQVHLDLAWDLWHAGLADEAIALLKQVRADDASGAAPLVAYTLAAFHEWGGKNDEAAIARQAAKGAPWQYCFPARLQEIAVLRAAIAADAADPRAPFYLGCLLYDRGRYDEAIACWERSAAADADFAPVWRCLGMAAFNVRHDTQAALDAYERAVAAAPDGGRLLYERDQLWKRLGVAPE
ncbi:MAG: tetratricopeptide repeat protein, partial [Sphingomonas sp.]